MRSSRVCQFAAITMLLLFCLPLLPVVSASGNGLLMDSNSLQINGDLEVGQGDINVTIDVQAHDVSAIGSINFTLVEGMNTIVASDNISLNLTSGEIITVQFNVSMLPVGQYTLDLQLYGSVGIASQNHTDHLNQFVKRLAPANPVLGDQNTWVLTPVNFDTGEASGNLSFRDGDIGWVVIPVTNSGEVAWNGSLGFNLQGGSENYLNVNLSPQSSTFVNFTLPQLSENNSVILNVNMSNQFISKSISVGPPPLARLNLTAEVNNSSATLSDEVTWFINASNNGEITWFGRLICNFSNVALYDEILTINAASLEPIQVILTVRPGELFCQLQGEERIHDDSIINFSFQYNMDAAHFSNAGSSGLVIDGTNFHVGDVLDATIIVHNGGDFSGTAKIQFSDSGVTSEGELRQFSVGHSLQLSISHSLLGISGEREIMWSVVSQDGLVDSNLSGVINLLVNPSQQLSASISTSSWTTSTGITTDVELMLSEGPSRKIHINVGYSNDDDTTTVISSELILSPGQRSLSYLLGDPVDADEVWIEVNSIDWSTSVISNLDDYFTITPPNLVPSIALGVANPPVPVAGDRTTIAYTLTNDGSDDISGGLIVLKLLSTNEILWEGSAPLVQAGDSQSGEIVIDTWPEGNLVDVELKWVTDHIETSYANSYPSKGEIISDDIDIPWSAIFLGLISGIVIASIARFVIVWQSEDPDERNRLKIERKKARVDARNKAQKSRFEKKNPKEKKEVPCPSCDMVLRVPNDYDGQARCPACTHVFVVKPMDLPIEEDEELVDEDIEEAAEIVDIPKPVKTPKKSKNEIKENSVEVKSDSKKAQSNDDKLISFSPNDEIRCPSCAQRLRVPYDKRPITARCPRCEIKFIAEKK